jgi:serine/threonine protein kinase
VSVGYGSSAVVYAAIYKPLQKKVAIKLIDLDMFERNQIEELRVCLLKYLLCLFIIIIT